MEKLVKRVEWRSTKRQQGVASQLYDKNVPVHMPPANARVSHARRPLRRSPPRQSLGSLHPPPIPLPHSAIAFFASRPLASACPPRPSRCTAVLSCRLFMDALSPRGKSRWIARCSLLLPLLFHTLMCPPWHETHPVHERIREERELHVYLRKDGWWLILLATACARLFFCRLFMLLNSTLRVCRKKSAPEEPRTPGGTDLTTHGLKNLTALPVDASRSRIPAIALLTLFQRRFLWLASRCL